MTVYPTLLVASSHLFKWVRPSCTLSSKTREIQFQANKCPRRDIRLTICLLASLQDGLYVRRPSVHQSVHYASANINENQRFTANQNEKSKRISCNYVSITKRKNKTAHVYNHITSKRIEPVGQVWSVF